MRSKGAIAILAAAALAMTGCAATDGSSSDQVELTFMNSVAPNFTVEQWQALVDEFQDANPDIKVNMITPPSADRDPYAKTLLAAGNFPDVAYGLQVAQFRDDLQPYDTSDPDIQRLQYLDQMVEGGELYQLGNTVQPWNMIFYNKDLFEQAGITGPPATRAEFETNLKKLKDAGITPILTGGEWVQVVTFLDLFPIFAENECWYGQRADGKVKFTDKEWIDAATTYQQWNADGYFNSGALGIGYTQLEQQFVSGQGAMYPMGSWFAGSPQPDFPVGVFPMPTDDGAGALAGSIGSVGYTVSKTSAHPEQALRLAKFLALSPSGVSAQAMAGNLTAVDLDEPIDFDPTPLQKAIQQLVAEAPSFYTTFNGQGDCNLVAGTQEEINKAAAAIFDGTPPEEALARVDEFWNDGS